MTLFSVVLACCIVSFALAHAGHEYQPSASSASSTFRVDERGGTFDDFAREFAAEHAAYWSVDDDDDDGAHECLHGASANVRRRVPMQVSTARHVGDDEHAPHERVRAARDARLYRGVRIFFDTQFVNGPGTCRQRGQKVTLDDAGQRNVTCLADDVLTPEKVKFLGLVLDQANKFLTNTIATVPVLDSLKLAGSQDGGEQAECVAFFGLSGGLQGEVSVQVPLSYRTAGVAGVDMIVFVTTKYLPGRARAFAQSCFQDNASGRPTAALINFSPSKLDNSVSSFPTAVHELLHAFGFNSDVFGSLRDAGWNPLPPNTGLMTDTLGNQLIITPNVVERAKAHYDCKSVRGVLLEQNDGGKHWEKAQLGDELMTATISIRFPSLSMMTLAMMADTNWYTTDYRRASPFSFGAHMGCDFVNKDCLEWAWDGYGQCYKEIDCAYDQQSYGKCRDVSSNCCIFFIFYFVICVLFLVE